MTECTRCSIVWHASCLVPPLPFSLRQQDEIVCSEECWTELVQATLAASGTEPQREAPGTTRKFLLRTPHGTSERPTMYPIISPRPHTQVQANGSCPTPTTHRATTGCATPDPPPQHWNLMEPSPRPQKRQRQPQKRDTKVSTAHTAVNTTEDNAEPVPQRWVAPEPSPRATKQQKRQTRQAP